LKVEIVSKTDNHFFSRQEIEFRVNDAKQTPSRKELREKIAALTNAKEESVIVDEIRQSFGMHKVLGRARIYPSKSKMEEVEEKFIIERNFGRKKKEETGKEPESSASTEKQSAEKPKEKAKRGA